MGELSEEAKHVSTQMMLANRRGDYRGAIRAGEDAIQQWPDDEVLRFQLARAYKGRGRVNQAVEQLEYILGNINAQNTYALDTLAQICVDQKDHAKARDHLNVSFSAQGREGFKTGGKLFSVLLTLNEVEEAYNLGKELFALPEGKTDARLLVGLAKMSLELGKKEGIYDYMQQLLDLPNQESHPKTLDVAVRIGADKRNNDYTEKIADMLLGKNPQNLAGLVLKMRAAAINGDLEAAQGVVEKLSESRFIASNTLSLRCAALGGSEEDRTWYRNFLKAAVDSGAVRDGERFALPEGDSSQNDALYHQSLEELDRIINAIFAYSRQKRMSPSKPPQHFRQ